MGLTVSNGSLVNKAGALGTGENCCCRAGVASCITGCQIPASITVSLAYQSTSFGFPTAGELADIQDIFDKSFVLDFDSIDGNGTALYLGPDFPDLGGGANVSQFQAQWKCTGLSDPNVDNLAFEFRIRRCGYGTATYDTAQSSFFRIDDAPIFYIPAKSQNAWCASPSNPAAKTFNMFFGTPTGSACSVSSSNYVLIYEATLVIS